MQTSIAGNFSRRTLNTLNTLTDKLLSTPCLYTVFCLVFLKPRPILKFDEYLGSALNLPSFPLFRVMEYIMMALVLLCYILRLATGKNRKVNPAFLCITGLFLYLALITFIFGGASGFHLDWHAGFVLMMMIDMGLQRERKSLICGLTSALEFWVYLNALTILLFPASFSPDPNVTEWVLGYHVYYYRILFPALAMVIVRYHVLGRKGKWRVAAMTVVCVFTVMQQRGATALVGMALFAALLIWCNRRALPRYISPVSFMLLAVLLFIGIQYFDLLNLFKSLVTKVLGKDMTLTRRTLLWTNTMEVVFNNPVTGIGYLPIAYKVQIFGEHAAHTHNQLLELMLHGGLIAVSLFIAALFFSAKAALLHRRNPAVKTIAILLCTFIFMGLVEIFHNDPIYYALFVLLARADCLEEGVRQLPRISVFKRIKRDLQRLPQSANE
ncbi:MAG: O-antigen ligase family protein [Clostridia bacterium]|nr:O-antigen ligase family protein [Clostridia bacterium]